MPLPTSHARPTRRLPPASRLVLLNGLVAAALCAVSTIMLLEMRREIDARANLGASGLVTLMARDVARNIELYDLSLRAIVDGLKEPRVREADPDLRRMILFDRAATATNFGLIAIIDPQGDTSLISRPAAPFNTRDRDYFRYHAAHADPDLRISNPVQSRSSGRWVIPLSRRLSHPDGAFAGIVVGAIFLDHFQQLFEAAGLQKGAVIDLLARDGTILMQVPFVQATVGASVAGTGTFDRMREAREGLFDGAALAGAERQRFAFAPVGDLPLMVSLSVPVTAIYAAWWRKAIALGGIVLALCGATLVLTALLRREVVQRRAAETATAHLNDALRQLAITDPLTGLHNRRRFDEVLARDLRRATRNGLPLSLILLDADAFKSFNDRYGHQRGDEALQMIARALTEGVDRPGATLCRIGGEEFAAILPETGLPEALRAAERMRQAVAACALPHAGTAHGIVTVSLGVAGLRGDDAASGVNEAGLVAAADAALYEAKRGGRNTVRLAAESGLAEAAPHTPG